ncbi:hypothetical protein CO612_00790 [Lysobacteraceae bacterium NML71-0210]|nr:hypothetical protein CO612_00790 [Xanthomonadaceae bacterium NML71-0210]
MSSNSRYQDVIDSLTHWRSPMPAALRRGWYGYQWREQRNSLLLLTSISCCVYLAFVLADWAMYPDIANISLMVRLPCTLAALAIIWRFKKQPAHAKRWDAVALPTVTLLGIASFYPILQHKGMVSTGYISSSLSYVVVACLITLTSFRWALIACAFIGMTALWACIQVLPSIKMALTEFGATFLPVYAFCLMVCWNRLLTSRRAYMRRILIEENVESLDSSNRILYAEAHNDTLTGISNRRAFEETFRKRLKQNSNSPSAFGLMLIDVDYFKAYNDHYGHLAGDQCLQMVAHVLHDTLSSNPHSLSANIFRIGGEEFAVLMEDAQPDTLHTLCNTLVNSVRDMHMPHISRPDELNSVTISTGACLVPAQTAIPRESVLTRTDHHLYQAKKQGRNQAVVGVL